MGAKVSMSRSAARQQRVQRPTKLDGVSRACGDVESKQKPFQSSQDLSISRDIIQEIHAVPLNPKTFEIFSEEVDDTDVVRRLFETLDLDTDGVISFSELRAHLDIQTDRQELCKALMEFFVGSSAIDFDQLKAAVQKIPRVPGRVQWVQSLHLESLLARHLKSGTILDGQSGIKDMREEEIRTSCAKFSMEVTEAVLDGWKKIKVEGTSTAEEVNSKFLMTEGAFTGKFAPLSDFYKGIEWKLGQPNPKLWDAMGKEHCARANAATLIITPNYGLCTSPRWEWQWVLDPGVSPTADDLKARLLSSGGKFPGEVGDVFTETLVTVKATTAAAAAAPAPAPTTTNTNTTSSSADSFRVKLDLLVGGPLPDDILALLG
jgi:hypothetical protein